jgi:hypothetical protein
MAIAFDASLSASSAKAGDFCELCQAGQTTREFVVLISEYDPRTTSPADQNWKPIPIPESGSNVFTVGITKHQADDDEFGPWSNNVYTVQGAVSFPWGPEFENSTLSLLTIETADGVLIFKEDKPSITVVIGALWGWFGLVGTLFSLCFIAHVKSPNALTRLKDTETIIAGVGSAV